MKQGCLRMGYINTDYDKLEKFRLHLSRCASRDAPLLIKRDFFYFHSRKVRFSDHSVLLYNFPFMVSILKFFSNMTFINLYTYFTSVFSKSETIGVEMF